MKLNGNVTLRTSGRTLLGNKGGCVVGRTIPVRRDCSLSGTQSPSFEFQSKESKNPPTRPPPPPSPSPHLEEREKGGAEEQRMLG